MKITKQEQHNKTTTPNITWFTPSVGATSTNCVLFLFLQKPQFICALSCRFLLPFDSRAHTSRLLRTQLQTFLTFLQKPSAHTAAEVVHAHSWDLFLPYKIQPYFTLLSYIKNPNLSIFHKRLFILRSFTKTMVLNHGHPQNPKP